MGDSQYFKSLTSRCGGVVSVDQVFRKGVSAGKGLLNGSQPIKEGKALYVETALGTLQHSRNLAIVCEHCKRFIGSLEQQINPLVTVRLSPAQRAALSTAQADKLEKRYRKAFPPLPSNFQLPALSSGESTISPVVECAYSCGDSYCSIECKNDAWRKYHALLCTSTYTAKNQTDDLTKDVIEHHHMHHGESGHEEHMHENEEEEEEEDEDDEEEMECEGVVVDEYNDGEAGVEVNAAALFQHQALATNEIFSLAGRMYCRVLEGWVRNGNDLMRALEPFRALHAQPWSQLFALQQEGLTMRNRFETKMNNLEENEEMSGEVEESEEEKKASLAHLQETIQEWLNDSVTILRSLVINRLAGFVDAVQSAAASRKKSTQVGGRRDGGEVEDKDGRRVGPSRTTLTPTEIEILFSPRTYEMLIGAFELNNIEMKIDSPLRDYMSTVISGLSPSARVDALASLSPVLRQIVKAKEARRQLAEEARVIIGDDEFDNDDEEEEDDDDDDDEDGGTEKEEVILSPDQFGGPLCINLKTLFPHCDGTALFALTCCANHSCVPNVQLQYNEDSTGVLVALRDLEAHEELCINYVGLDQPTELRQADLRHYGFTCSCERCTAESKS
jgi:hypothetical protein